jgi:hypothetical protein
MQDVFEVVEVSQISADQWLVRGRAWQTIKVGDTVYSAVGRAYRTIIEKDAIYSVPIETEIAPTLYPFVVLTISTYGRQIEQLDSVLTGDIVVKGEHGISLQETKLLVTL